MTGSWDLDDAAYSKSRRRLDGFRVLRRHQSAGSRTTTEGIGNGSRMMKTFGGGDFAKNVFGGDTWQAVQAVVICFSLSLVFIVPRLVAVRAVHDVEMAPERRHVTLQRLEG